MGLGKRDIRVHLCWSTGPLSFIAEVKKLLLVFAGVAGVNGAAGEEEKQGEEGGEEGEQLKHVCT